MSPPSLLRVIVIGGALVAGGCPTFELAAPDDGVAGAGDEDLAAATFALAGDLDPGYGPGGFTVTDVDLSASATGYAVARQAADGKLVVAGDAYNGARSVGIVGRVNPDGSRDLTFGGKAWVPIDLGESGKSLTLRGVAVQADGKIVVVGRASLTLGGQAYAYVARFEPDGRPDTTFGDGGSKLIASGATSFGASALAVQSNGRIVVAGSSSPGGGNVDALVLRLGANGQLDASFDADGLRTIDVGAFDNVTAVAVQSDGKIVLGGTRYSTTTPSQQMFAIRVGSNGASDPSFSGDGIALAVLNDKDTASGLALQADGKLVLAGQTYAGTATNYDTALVRFTTTGVLDTSFSGDGKLSFAAAAASDGANAVVVTTGGQLLVAGSGIQPGGRTDALFARVTSAGVLDTSFGGDGMRLHQFGTGVAARAVVLQPDGRAVAVGNRNDGADGRLALLRANTSGALDANFDGDGGATLPLHSGQDKGLASAMQPDGKLVVAGTTHDGFRDVCLVVRYTAGGVLDPTFSGDGKLTFTFDGTSSCRLDAAAIQPDGKVVVADGFQVARLTTAGALDGSFDGDGRHVLTIAEGVGGESDVAVASDGKIWLGGSIRQLGISRFGLVRLDPNGSLDTTYSSDGWTTSYFSSADHELAKIVVLADGRVVALGTAVGTGPMVTRFTAAGAIDGNFGLGGRRQLAVGAFNENAAALLVAPDGKIVAVTNAIHGIGVVSTVVSQLTSGGALDTTFDLDGQRIVQPLSLTGAAGVLRQANGKLVVVGRGADLVTQTGGCLFMRFNTSGALDAGYGGGDGWVLHQPGYICNATDARFVPGTDTVVAAGYDTLVAPPPAEPTPQRGDTTPWDVLVMRVQAQ